MPDTCLDTTKSQSPDVRLMRVLQLLDNNRHGTLGGGVVVMLTHADWHDVAAELHAIASDLRATIGRPAPRASDLIDLIRACATKGDVMACVWDHKTALRQMEPGEAVRALTEALIAMARQGMGGRG
jgi:hypothetical protein